MRVKSSLHSWCNHYLSVGLLTLGMMGLGAIAPQSAEAANITGGKTTSPSYVKNVSGNGGYQIIPLLTVGDEVSSLEGNFGNFTVNPNKSYAFAGVPDGLGLFETKDYNYVFVNHEISDLNRGRPVYSYLNSSDPDKIQGARVSLFQFDKNWNVLGGKNLIETVVDNATGATYYLDTTKGAYIDPFTAAAFSFSRFCAGFLAEYGFEGGPVYFGPEEFTPGGRGWAIAANGTAQSVEGLGQYSKENVISASQYRAENSNKTVLLSPEDFADGELYMYVGEQTADDPNGFKNGDLYVLKVEGTEEETLQEKVPTKATWVKVPKEIALGKGEDLSNWVNANARSTDFERPEDLHEDPNNPGTFYFVTTGTTEKLPNGQVENQYGKLYRFSLNPDDPIGEMTNFELLLSGGPGKGVSYDNMVVDRNGNVLIQEDETANSNKIMEAEKRDASIWSYNIATGKMTRMFEVDETAGRTLKDPGVGIWESSGIIEVDPKAQPGRSSYLFDVQAHELLSTRYVEGGQLLLAKPIPEPSTTAALSLFGLTALGWKLKRQRKQV